MPLYTGLLSAWLKLFGVSLFAERALNLVLFAVFLVLIWRWMVGTRIVQERTWRIAAIVVLACGHAMVFSYRSGRYDVGLLLPFAGLQLIPGALVLGTLAIVFAGSKAIRPVAALIFGIGLGWVGLRLFYGAFGAWDGFRASTAAIGLIGQSLTSKLRVLPGAYATDKSRVLMFMALLIAAGFTWRKLGPDSRRMLGFATSIVILLPAALHLAGKFPIYYGWMVFVPLVIVTAHSSEQSSAKPAIVGLFILASIVGLPLRLPADVSAYAERSPERVQQFVSGQCASWLSRASRLQSLLRRPQPRRTSPNTYLHPRPSARTSERLWI